MVATKSDSSAEAGHDQLHGCPTLFVELLSECLGIRAHHTNPQFYWVSDVVSQDSDALNHVDVDSDKRKLVCL